MPQVSVHEYRCPMRWGDMDAQGHVNNAVYLDYLQEARVDFLLSGPPVLHALLDTGVLVASHQVEYLRPVVFSDRPVAVRLWVDSVGGSRFSLAYEVFDGAELAARARTVAVPFDLATNTLRRLTADERVLFVEAMMPTEPLRTVTKIKIGDQGHRYDLLVRWSDLDSYGHVNNVKYYDYLQEARIALIAATLGEEGSGQWLVVRQDLEYRRPIDFRTTPYAVVTAVAEVGNRSVTLAAEIRDDTTTYATARTVLVGERPWSADQRAALDPTRARR